MAKKNYNERKWIAPNKRAEGYAKERKTMIQFLIRYVSIVFCISYILQKLINTKFNAKKTYILIY